MRTQISAIERLQSLPSVFRGADLTVRFQWSSKTASHYLYLWKRRGLVGGLGGHSDVFANLLTHPRPDWEQALRMAMPSAVVMGVEALRRAGWTTQVPHRPTVAVNARQPVFKAEAFDITAREPVWFEQVRPGLQEGGAGLPRLSPAWALADMLHHPGWGACGLWPDDVAWSEVNAQDESDWRSACRVFKLPATPLDELAVASR
jgi:hypothetical protein